jgi:dolichol-phosphate mannosyltransferase
MTAHASTGGPPALPKIAVVIPCYRVVKHILQVLGGIPAFVDLIICVDDCCPDKSGQFIASKVADPRVRVIFNPVNLGVGGAMIAGYRAAMQLGADIVVKIDGDGQMDPALIARFVAPIVRGNADYAKGNRFYRPESLSRMPVIRLFGNAVLSFMSKMSTGYWNLFDPTNGYTAIHTAALRQLPLDKISERYFFESDLLFRLSTVRAVVVDVPMDARYEDEKSNLSISRIVGPFIGGHLRNTLKRLVYSYFLRDFNFASLHWLLGPILLAFGIGFGAYEWSQSLQTGVTASAGTVMLSALPIIVGLQMVLSAFNFDVANVPRRPLHIDLTETEETSLRVGSVAEPAIGPGEARGGLAHREKASLHPAP